MQHFRQRHNGKTERLQSHHSFILVTQFDNGSCHSYTHIHKEVHRLKVPESAQNRRGSLYSRLVRRVVRQNFLGRINFHEDIDGSHSTSSDAGVSASSSLSISSCVVYISVAGTYLPTLLALQQPFYIVPRFLPFIHLRSGYSTDDGSCPAVLAQTHGGTYLLDHCVDKTKYTLSGMSKSTIFHECVLVGLSWIIDRAVSSKYVCFTAIMLNNLQRTAHSLTRVECCE